MQQKGVFEYFWYGFGAKLEGGENGDRMLVDGIAGEKNPSAPVINEEISIR